MNNRPEEQTWRTNDLTTKNRGTIWQRRTVTKNRGRTDLSGRLDDLSLICMKNSEDREEEEVWAAYLLQFCFHALHRHHPNKLLPFAGGGSDGGAGIVHGGNNGGWSWWLSLLVFLEIHWKKKMKGGLKKKNGGTWVYKTRVLRGIFSTSDATGWVSAWVSSFKNSSSIRTQFFKT